MRFDQVAAEILQAATHKDRAAHSCAEAQAALELAANPKDKEHVGRVVQQRKENLAQLDAKLAELQRTQKDFEETLCIPSEAIEYRDTLAKPSGIGAGAEASK